VTANNAILNNLTMPTLSFILLYNSMARSHIGPVRLSCVQCAWLCTRAVYTTVYMAVYTTCVHDPYSAVYTVQGRGHGPCTPL